MTSHEQKKAQDAARARKYRRNRKEQRQIKNLEAASDTPLGRELFGLAPKAEEPAATSQREYLKLPLVDYSEGGNGIPGQRERVETVYGAAARKRAQAEIRNREVVDYVPGARAATSPRAPKAERAARSGRPASSPRSRQAPGA